MRQSVLNKCCREGRVAGELCITHHPSLTTLLRLGPLTRLDPQLAISNNGFGLLIYHAIIEVRNSKLFSKKMGMSELTFVREEEQQEFDDMGSFNHSTVQANLAYLLKRIGKYTISVELSLDSSRLDKSIFDFKDELIPDLCVYPKRQLFKSDDILKMTEMPVIAIEVLSFRQFPSTLVEKFKAYFALGIQSCWLVDPVTRTIHVYSAADMWRSFSIEDELVDKPFDIHFPVREVFED